MQQTSPSWLRPRRARQRHPTHVPARGARRRDDPYPRGRARSRSRAMCVHAVGGDDDGRAWSARRNSRAPKRVVPFTSHCLHTAVFAPVARHISPQTTFGRFVLATMASGRSARSARVTRMATRSCAAVRRPTARAPLPMQPSLAATSRPRPGRSSRARTATLASRRAASGEVERAALRSPENLPGQDEDDVASAESSHGRGSYRSHREKSFAEVALHSSRGCAPAPASR